MVGLQLWAGPSGQPLVHCWVVGWLGCLGLGLFVLRSFWNWLDVVCVQWVQRLVGWLDAPWLVTPPNDSNLTIPMSYITHDLSINPPLVIMVWSFFYQSRTTPWVSWWSCEVVFHQSRSTPSAIKDWFPDFSYQLVSSRFYGKWSCLCAKWVSWCTVRGLPSPGRSILFENWRFVIGRAIITCCSNTRYSLDWRTTYYPRTPRPEWIVRPRRRMACLWTVFVGLQPTWISSLPSVKGRCHPLVSTICHPRTMAVGCLHRQWSLSNVPRATVFLPDRRLGRAGMQGLSQSSHCHRQYRGHQRSWR